MVTVTKIPEDGAGPDLTRVPTDLLLAELRRRIESSTAPSAAATPGRNEGTPPPNTPLQVFEVSEGDESELRASPIRPDSET
ncbi:hypothetical protein RAJCM14343_3174 [Rhodococcus aetherivorans]|uniref:Uncharacterized protein n=1 Tax=Rhodococcus aetherivorans TaxID=191292 RepID=A0ABQ0YMX0_9NOCA|nr:hypothetical protein AAT18_04515 [Rhodococcus aetherivorans]ETT24610.1 hypothetical protein RR21198_4443 [Rhodococcus rhodochrous ATCC 21198]KDE14748.1 hypothetical protein N505_0101200 [Rhodococcus aetherivorans]NGP29174.1 hypothetical protein [Rhodococcus aetherivorans]GES37915.1 hypothetical protein RAJCM14343_3174 [Rhodococcus aetherivorans]